MTRTPTEVPFVVHGYLVGQTQDVPLVGDIDGPHRKITSVPTEQIRRVVLGPEAATEVECSG